MLTKMELINLLNENNFWSTFDIHSLSELIF